MSETNMLFMLLDVFNGSDGDKTKGLYARLDTSHSAAHRLAGGLMKPKDWLVWDAKGRLWWKAEGKGYTRRLAEAGRFTESEALKHQIASDLTIGGDRHDVAIPLSAVENQ